jgi:hypothetical protein
MIIFFDILDHLEINTKTFSFLTSLCVCAAYTYACDKLKKCKSPKLLQKSVKKLKMTTFWDHNKLSEVTYILTGRTASSFLWQMLTCWTGENTLKSAGIRSWTCNNRKHNNYGSNGNIETNISKQGGQETRRIISSSHLRLKTCSINGAVYTTTQVLCYMFQPSLGHHQESHKNINLSSWIK